MHTTVNYEAGELLPPSYNTHPVLLHPEGRASISLNAGAIHAPVNDLIRFARLILDNLDTPQARLRTRCCVKADDYDSRYPNRDDPNDGRCENTDTWLIDGAYGDYRVCADHVARRFARQICCGDVIGVGGREVEVTRAPLTDGGMQRLEWTSTGPGDPGFVVVHSDTMIPYLGRADDRWLNRKGIATLPDPDLAPAAAGADEPF